MQARSLAAVFVLAALSIPGRSAQPADAHSRRISEAMPSLGFSSGAAVLSTSIVAGAVRIDFSAPTAEGLTDGSLEALTDAARIAYEGIPGITEWTFTCNGRLLSSYLAPVPQVVPQPDPGSGPRAKRAVSPGPLSGKKIAISPGHGWTYTGSGWGLQRGYWQGIVEDFLNPEFMQYVYNILVNNGATVYPCRELDKTYGDCTTAFTFAGVNRSVPNKPWWQMAAVYYAVRQGAASSVYDNGRTTDGNRDIAARPLYANWRGADIMVSIHNNGDSGTATGTLTMYETGNGYRVTDAANQYGSQYLAEKVHSRVISELRANYLSNWYSYGAQGFAGNYGENNFFKGPACIVEAAFMDTPVPDNAALHDENYKMLVAKAIYKGICDYFHVSPSYATNIAAPGGIWTADPLAKTWSVKLGSPVNAAPSSSGGWVYAGTDAGAVYGVPATAASGFTPGAIRWRYPASGSLGAAVKARPTVYNNTVFAVAVNGKMVALDRLTGALLWATNVATSGSLVCPAAATPDGRVIVGSDNGRLYSYSQATGALLATFPSAFGPINAQVSVPDSGHVWVSSDDGYIRCLSGDLTTVLWQRFCGAAVRSAPYVLATNNGLYVSTTARKVIALNASNGNPAPGWPSGGQTTSANIGTSAWADGASGIVAFATDTHTITAVSTENGAVPDDFPLRPAGVRDFTSTPVVLNGTVYIGGTDGRLYALHRSNGAADPGDTWRAFSAESEGLPGQFNAAPCLTGQAAGDVVVAGNTNGYLYAFPI